jgi:hypothetical protein
MFKYFLAGNINSEPHHHKFENIRELSELEIKRFHESVNTLNSINITISLFEVCEENYLAMEKYYQKLSLMSGGNQLDWHKVVIKWNTLTLNYLSSFRMFVDHHEATLERGEESQNNLIYKFKEITAFHYDKYFSYRFLWDLRNYIQHVGLPACSWEFSAIKENSDIGKCQVEIVYKRDGLLTGFDWKKLKKEIESQPLEIDVIHLMRELFISITDITKFIVELQRMSFQEPMNYLTELINEVKTKYPDAEPNILKWDVQEDLGTKPKLIGLLPFPLRIMVNLKEML